MRYFAAAQPDPQEFRAALIWFFFQSSVLCPILQRIIPNTMPGVSLFISGLLNLAGCLWISRKAFHAEGRHAVQTCRSLLAAVAAGLAVYYISTVGLTAALRLLAPEYRNINDDSIVQAVIAQPVLSWISVSIFAPVAEEFFFRRILFRTFYPRSRIWAHFLCACLFSCAHIAGFVGRVPLYYLLLSFLQYLPAGLCLSAGYAYSGNLLVPILMHSLINSISFLHVR